MLLTEATAKSNEMPELSGIEKKTDLLSTKLSKSLHTSTAPLIAQYSNTTTAIFF